MYNTRQRYRKFEEDPYTNSETVLSTPNLQSHDSFVSNISNFKHVAETLHDSHDFEPDESHLFRENWKERIRNDRSQWWTKGRRISLLRWMVTFGTGVGTGLTAILLSNGTSFLTNLKFSSAHRLMYNGPTFEAYAVYTLFNVVYVSFANLMVVFEPLAAGSGIPEIKCFLNGINLLGVIQPKTLFAKVVGVMFSVAGGLPAGKEGPMVHSGSVIAATLNQWNCESFGYRDLKNDKEKRDFVACGTAAGVAAAFGAPIGGVLFSLEEGASYWSTRLTWRAFFCAMITVFTLYFVRSSNNLWGQQDLIKMFSFGEFGELTIGHGNYSVWELSIFILIGCAGGIIGGLFNNFNEKISLWRMKNLNKCKKKRFVEAISLAFVMSFISFLFPMIWRKCTPRPVNIENWSIQEKLLLDSLVSFNCERQTEYNEVASLFFTDADTAIRQLFHFREGGDNWTSDQRTFSSGALIMYFLPYIFMACVTYGAALPSGLFVPSLLSGAAFGRLIGHLLHKFEPNANNSLFADSGTYALIGAAAVLGGMARMTISLTVILLEATGDMQYVLPIMLTLMAARWTGNIFNEGLYDIHINLQDLTYLEDEVPDIAYKSSLNAGNFMSRQVKCFREREKVGYIFDILNNFEHHCFPIIDEHSGILLGTVMRKCLTVLIFEGVHLENTGGRNRMVDFSTFEKDYPFYPTIKNYVLDESDRNFVLDLRPYINTAPHIIYESSSLSRTYRAFRTLGLRHLCVVDRRNRLKGIITRKNLDRNYLKRCLKHLKIYEEYKSQKENEGNKNAFNSISEADL